MKTLKYIIALSASLALLYVVHALTLNRPRTFSGSDNGYTFEVTTTPLAVVEENIELTVIVTGPLADDVKPVIRKSKFSQDKTTNLTKYSSTPLSAEDSTSNIYSVIHKVGRKGYSQYYYFEVRDKIGGRRAVFMRPDDLPFKILNIGAIPVWLLVGHALFIFGIFFFVFLAAIEAVSLLKNANAIGKTARLIFVAAIIALIGCYPLGFALNSFKTGTFWEGVPFGTHIDNNKIQLLFVYLLFLSLATIGSLTRGKFGRDLFTTRTTAWFTLAAPLLCLAAVLIPHSYPAEPMIVKQISWSFIGLTAAIFGIGTWLSSKRKSA